MGRRTLIAVVNGTQDRCGERLRRHAYDVISYDRCASPDTDPGTVVPDLVLIDATADRAVADDPHGDEPGGRGGQPGHTPGDAQATGATTGPANAAARALAGVLAQVRACRLRFPSPIMPVLVLGLSDPAAGTAAIDAGATDAPMDAFMDASVESADPAADPGARLDAHVRRVLRSIDALRAGQAAAEQAAAFVPPDLARATADVAKPLGQMLDELEAVIARTGGGDAFDPLLEQIGQAVDALDRLRRLTSGGG